MRSRHRKAHCAAVVGIAVDFEGPTSFFIELRDERGDRERAR